MTLIKLEKIIDKVHNKSVGCLENLNHISSLTNLRMQLGERFTSQLRKKRNLSFLIQTRINPKRVEAKKSHYQALIMKSKKIKLLRQLKVQWKGQKKRKHLNEGNLFYITFYILYIYNLYIITKKKSKYILLSKVIKFVHKYYNYYIIK